MAERSSPSTSVSPQSTIENRRDTVTRVGIVGCGAIGSLIAKAADDGIVKCDELVLYDNNPEKTANLRRSLRLKSSVVDNIEDMIARAPAVIVEAASQQAVKEYLPRILREDIEVIVMSVGALLGMQIDSRKVHTSSGAIGGIDAIRSASLAGIDEITLTSRKNPQVLKTDKNAETVVFDGDAEVAVKLFPKEMNVAASLALAVQPKKVRVKVVSDPKVERNVHEIRVSWSKGEMVLRFENEPHPDNLGTSALAAWSAIRLLKDLLEKQL
jgi:aspartate dehydrogenase